MYEISKGVNGNKVPSVHNHGNTAALVQNTNDVTAYERALWP